jgi:hypothetical protein
VVAEAQDIENKNGKNEGVGRLRKDTPLAGFSLISDA